MHALQDGLMVVYKMDEILMSKISDTDKQLTGEFRGVKESTTNSTAQMKGGEATKVAMSQLFT
jgi:hypothetical protein